MLCLLKLTNVVTGVDDVMCYCVVPKKPREYQVLAVNLVHDKRSMWADLVSLNVPAKTRAL